MEEAISGVVALGATVSSRLRGRDSSDGDDVGGVGPIRGAISGPSEATGDGGDLRGSSESDGTCKARDCDVFEESGIDVNASEGALEASDGVL